MMHFGCVELVEQHGSTRASKGARHVERVVSRRDVTMQVEFGLISRLFCRMLQQSLYTLTIVCCEIVICLTVYSFYKVAQKANTFRIVIKSH